MVAADDGWSAQTAEHVAVLDALGVRHALLAVTKADLADPAPVLADATERLARTSMGAVPGGGGQRAHRRRGARSWPPRWSGCWPACPRRTPTAPVRLWIDRAFTIRGAGTVVTGTLAAGTVAHRGPAACWATGTSSCAACSRSAEPVERAAATARVALNLRGIAVEDLSRGDALLTPGAFRSHRRRGRRRWSAGAGRTGCPAEPVVHVGSATVGARVRPLDGAVVRLRLDAAAAAAGRGPAAAARPGCPAGAGRRRPGRRPARAAPPRRGPAAGRRPGRAAGRDAGAAADLARRRVVRAADFAAMGWPVPPRAPTVHGPWLLAAGPGRRARRPGARRRRRATGSCARWSRARRSRCVRRALDLPDAELVPGAGPAAARAARRAGGRRRTPGCRRTVQRAVDRDPGPAGRRPVRRARGPATLAAAGLGPRELAAAVRERSAGAHRRRRLPRARGRGRGAGAAGGARRSRSPLSQARQAWGTSRRVAVPLMEWLDARGVTVRLPDNTRRLR